jgi:hypothetical protein
VPFRTAASRTLRRANLAIGGSIAIMVALDLAGRSPWSASGASVNLAPGTPFGVAAAVLLAVRWAMSRRASATTSFNIGEDGIFAWRFDPPSAAAGAWALLLFSAATAVMLREQLRAYTSVPDLGDPLFSMWRLAWVAHQLAVDPRHLFDANIFHPATRTLAYSDAMLAPAALAAPAIWTGVPLAVVYTTLLLLSYVSAGMSMFVLSRSLTGHTGAALVAGLVFAFDPFRFLHYSHFELQWTFAMPLALLFVVRALTTGRLRDGALAGLWLAVQALCSLYYGAYFAVSLAVFVAAWMCVVQPIDRAKAQALALGLAIAAAGCLPVTLPYWHNRATLGQRQPDEIRAYSATGHDYLTAYRQSAVYGERLWDTNDAERKLFPGVVPMLLGALALWAPVTPLAITSAATLAVVVDASLGLHGTVYPWLYKFVPGFGGFRVPARFRAIGGLYLALITGFAVAAIVRRMPSTRIVGATLAVVAVAILIDAHPVLALQPLWNHPPGIYRMIPEPAAVVADLPIPWDRDPFWHDPVFMYFSTFHWHPLVNGSSGFAPAWYDQLGQISRDYPSDETLDVYRRLGVQYVVLHEGYYGARTFQRVVGDSARQLRLQFVAADTWDEGECRLYRLLR